MLEGYYVKKIGQNRGAPRIWLEGSLPTKAGFAAGQRFDISVDGKTVVLQANTDGSRVVSNKVVGERSNPVIDLNSKELLAIFDGMAAIRVVVKKDQIYLLPLASELKKQERYLRLREKLEKQEPLTMGSLSHGIGVLSHAIHSGLEKAGVKSELAFANEIREDLLEHAERHNDAWSDDTKVLNAPMQELAFDQRGLAHIPKVDILEMGLPCSGASRAGKSKRGLVHAEAHPEVGHLVVSALIIVNQSNAAVVLLENVPEYAQSASADILRNQLRDLGYVTHERILKGEEWGVLEGRNRWCMVAVTEGIEFDFDQLMAPGDRDRNVAAILDESIGEDDPRWRTFSYLKEKEVRDAEKGNSFSMQTVKPSDKTVPTLRKGYHKGGSTDPLLEHPTDPTLLRQFTATEHARIKEVPVALVDGLSNTVAHEGLGQGILYLPFQDVGTHMGDALNRWAGRPVREQVEVVMSVESFAKDVAASVVEMASSMGVRLNANEARMRLATGEGPERGLFVGKIVALDSALGVAIQSTGCGRGEVHPLNALSREVEVGVVETIAYENGRGAVAEHQKQLGLGIGGR